MCSGMFCPVVLDPGFELGDRDEDELAPEDDLELGVHRSLEVVEADSE